MMKQAGVDALPSANSILVNGLFMRMRKLRSSITSIASSCLRMIAPIVSRNVQRLNEAAASFASTGAPSWNLRPVRSLKVQVLKSSVTS